MNLKEIAHTATKISIPEWMKVDIPGNHGKAPYYRFLYLLAQRMKPPVMVELGTMQGLGAMCMAKGNPDGRVIAIDKNVADVHPACIMPNVKYLKQDSLQEYNVNDIGILFIDTEHNGRALLEYEAWKDRMAKGGVILFDDITLNQEMREFWEGFNPEGQKIDLLELHGFGFGAVVI